MAQLKIQRNGRTETIALSGMATTVGSAATCQLVVTGPQVAPSHCRLVRTDRGYLIQDLNTPGGTTVNGQKVAQQLLKDGDTIQIGPNRCVFADDGGSQKSGHTSARIPKVAAVPAAAAPAPARDTGTRRKPTTSIIKRDTRSIPKARGTEDEESGAERSPAQQPQDDKSKLYIGLGVGGVVLLIIIAVAMSGGGGGKSKVDVENSMTKAVEKIKDAESRRDYARALELCNEVINNPKYKKSDRYGDVQRLAEQYKAWVNAERDAPGKIAAFKQKVEKAKADQTVMAKSTELLEECKQLLVWYGNTAGAKDLLGLRDDLQRMVNTESQDVWQKDFNRRREQIMLRHVDTGDYATAVREWQKFKEISQDPLFHSKVGQEINEINMKAKADAEKLVADVASLPGDQARQKLEAERERFMGTDGQAVITRKLSTIK